MRELAGRVSSLDPDAGAALHAIAYFDALVESRAGLEAVVRAAAVLAGCAAGLRDPARRAVVRVLPDGRREDGEPTGTRAPLHDDDGAVVWLERPAGAGDPARDALDAVILERMAATARIVLDRTRPLGRREDPAAVELLVDPGAAPEVRRAAARRLALVGDAFVVTVGSGAPPAGSRVAVRPGDLVVTVEAAGTPGPRPARHAVGPAVGLDDLPLSHELARLALRLTTAPDEPGPTSVDAAEVTGLLALADGCDSGAASIEVAAIERVVARFGWAPTTLFAVAADPSLRAAATRLHVHHSTLQERVDQIGHALGWSVVTPAGRTRLAIALALRLLRANRW